MIGTGPTALVAGACAACFGAAFFVGTTQRHSSHHDAQRLPQPAKVVPATLPAGALSLGQAPNLPGLRSVPKPRPKPTPSVAPAPRAATVRSVPVSAPRSVTPQSSPAPQPAPRHVTPTPTPEPAPTPAPAPKSSPQQSGGGNFYIEGG